MPTSHPKKSNGLLIAFLFPNMANARFKVGLSLILLFTFFTGRSIWAADGILHLELGAANYGYHYFLDQDSLDKKYRILAAEVTKLIEEYGPTGITYLNDINDEGLDQAEEYLRKWLDSRGYSEIEIVKKHGNYNRMSDLPHVKTANLNNPGWNQLALPPEDTKPEKFQKLREQHSFDLWMYDSPEEYNENVIAGLEKIAALSETGLRISTYFWGGYNQKDLITPTIAHLKGSILNETKQMGEPYFGSDGRTTLSADELYPDRNNSPRVFYLLNKSSYLCAPALTLSPQEYSIHN